MITDSLTLILGADILMAESLVKNLERVDGRSSRGRFGGIVGIDPRVDPGQIRVSIQGRHAGLPRRVTFSANPTSVKITGHTY